MLQIYDLLYSLAVKSEFYFSFCLQQQNLIFAIGAIPPIVGIGMMSSTG